MGQREQTKEYLKENMADALILLLKQKPLRDITIDEITAQAGVGRMTYFRNFHSKQELVTYKLIQLWARYTEENNMEERHRFSYDNALHFFQYNKGIEDFLRTIYAAGLEDSLFDSFISIMLPPDSDDVQEWYRERFYSYALFGILDGWIRRDFAESAEEMAKIIGSMRMAHRDNTRWATFLCLWANMWSETDYR